MTTADENMTLGPLPKVIIVDPLTRVIDIEGRIAVLQEQINDLTVQRTEALNYAITNSIEEEGRYRLDKKTRITRSLNITRFRAVFPDEYKIACDIERKDKEDALTHIGEKINLTLVDRLVKKPALEAAQGVISVKESISYQVVFK